MALWRGFAWRGFAQDGATVATGRAVVIATWRAPGQPVGQSFTVEPLRGRAGALLSDRLALLGLGAVFCALTRYARCPNASPIPNSIGTRSGCSTCWAILAGLHDYALWD